VDIPGFPTGSYITFLMPGIVLMSALYGAGWTGMGVIDELDRGVIDRLLVTPTSRASIIGGRLLSGAITNIIGSLLLVLLGTLMSAHYPGGALGILVLLASAVMLATPIGALSIALALTLRRRESVIGASNFILLPMTFLSPVFMASNVMPQWIQSVARFSPLTWGVQAARLALGQADPDWPRILIRLALLLVFGAAAGWLAIRAINSYQRSI
jgi:ABC-2 type transport system permease protein